MCEHRENNWVQNFKMILIHVQRFFLGGGGRGFFGVLVLKKILISVSGGPSVGCKNIHPGRLT